MPEPHQRSIDVVVQNTVAACTDGDSAQTVRGSISVRDASDTGNGSAEQKDTVIGSIDLFVYDKGSNNKGKWENSGAKLTKIWLELDGVDGFDGSPGGDHELTNDSDLSDGWQGLVVMFEEEPAAGDPVLGAVDGYVVGDEVTIVYEFENPDALGDPFLVTAEIGIEGRGDEFRFSDTEDFYQADLLECWHDEVA